MIRKPPALKPIVEALADFKVLKVWIVPLESLIVYLYLIDMVLFSSTWFKQGGGIAPLWFTIPRLRNHRQAENRGSYHHALAGIVG